MGGAPSLPTPSTPGYTSWTDCYGKRWTVCTCLGQWLTAAQRLGLARGLIKQGLDVVQTTGGAPASGGTHTKGGVVDTLQRSREWSHLFREMGAAAWPRLDPNPGKPGDAWDDNEHMHAVIDCPHNTPAAYQVTAYWRGYSGLGQARTGTYAGQWGYGSKDPDPWRPSTRRTWREGIAWAQAQLNQEDDIMADRETAQALWTGYAIVKDMTASDPNKAPRVTPSNQLEAAVRAAVKAADPRTVWEWDGIASPDKDPANPTWAAASYLREIYRQDRNTARAVGDLAEALADLAAKVEQLGKATGA